MPFPKAAQRRGGQAPATDFQKQVSREWIQKNRPWKRSTGPKSSIGKIAVCYNGQQGIFKKWATTWRQEDFDKACAMAEDAISALEQDYQTHKDQYKKFKVKRLQGATTGGDRWILFVVQAEIEGFKQEVSDRLKVIEKIRLRYGSEGPMKCRIWEDMRFDDPWLRRILAIASSAE